MHISDYVTLPRRYQTFFMLNSTEHETSTVQKTKRLRKKRAMVVYEHDIRVDDQS